MRILILLKLLFFINVDIVLANNKDKTNQTISIIKKETFIKKNYSETIKNLRILKSEKNVWAYLFHGMMSKKVMELKKIILRPVKIILQPLIMQRIKITQKVKLHILLHNLITMQLMI